MIALVILIGMSVKNSILIVSWSNTLRRAGKNIQNATMEACRRRFRAILMTSASTCIAVLPLIIGNIGPGAGEAARLAIGSTIFGGIFISTATTLFVTPTMYVLLTKNIKSIDATETQLNKELKRFRKSNPPNKARGTVKKITKGERKLLKFAERTRKAVTKASAKMMYISLLTS